MLQEPDVVPAGREFDNLPADANERTRRELAARLLPQICDLYTDYPGLLDAGGVANASTAAHAVDVAVGDLYNSAQRDVLRRVGQEFRDSPKALRDQSIPES